MDEGSSVPRNAGRYTSGNSEMKRTKTRQSSAGRNSLARQGKPIFQGSLAKSVTREFRLSINLPEPFGKWANEVIASIENPFVWAFYPDDCTALDFPRMSYVQGSGRMQRVNLYEWLPVCLQECNLYTHGDNRIMEDFFSLGGLCSAIYASNIRTSVLSVSPVCPGPFGFHGRISFFSDMLVGRRRNKETHFKGLIAHELIHAFNAMSFIVPATLDWSAFQNQFLGGNTDREMKASEWLCNENKSLDLYRRNIDIEILSKWWPSYAEKWSLSTTP